MSLTSLPTFKNNKIAGQVYDLSTFMTCQADLTCRGSRRIGKNTKFFFHALARAVAKQRKEVTHPSKRYGHTARMVH